MKVVREDFEIQTLFWLSLLS